MVELTQKPNIYSLYQHYITKHFKCKDKTTVVFDPQQFFCQENSIDRLDKIKKACMPRI
jgi:hypothetical protein